MQIIWSIVGVVVPVLIGLGYSSVGFTPPEFRFARFCFWISAVLLALTDIFWHLQTDWKWYLQLMVATPIWALVLFALPSGLRWSRRREKHAAPSVRDDSRKLYGADNRLVDLSSYPTGRTTKRRIAYVMVSAIVLGVLSGAGWVSLQKMLAPAFSIMPGAAWIDPESMASIFWIQLHGTNKVTPINVLAFYTITNLKSTPSLISDLTLQMSGAGGQWYPLRNLPTHTGAIWEADGQRAEQDVTLLELRAGFLLDKIAGKVLKPGEPIQGWLMCQIPASYIPDSTSNLRLRVRDTALSETTQPLDMPSTDNNVLFTEVNILGHLNLDFSKYGVVLY